MKRALVLNAGLSWTAYQIGALRHLIVDRAMHFEMCAGTGTGAMNAAFVACGEFVALEAFWKSIRLRRLVSLNWRTPWRGGPLTGAPQRRFIAAPITEEKLAERGVTLLVSLMNLQTGQEQVMTYPGNDLPLVDALTAAVATCGILPPVLYQNQQLASGAFINSFILHTVLQQAVEEVIAVAAAAQRGLHNRRRYMTWPVLFERALAMNLAHDVWGAFDEGEKVSAAATAFRHVSAQLPTRLAERVADPTVREQLVSKITDIYCNSLYPLKRAAGPILKPITPSRDLGYPMWRFRSEELAAAKALGYRDARTAMEREEGER
jgi:predicted acylesterase/phospholipase RssA